MARDRSDRIDVGGNPDAAAEDRLNMQPGRLEDIESAEARATRSGQRDVTGERPAPTVEGERLHDREDMSAHEGMADLSDAPMERGERQAHTGGGAHRLDRERDQDRGMQAGSEDVGEPMT